MKCDCLVWKIQKWSPYSKNTFRTRYPYMQDHFELHGNNLRCCTRRAGCAGANSSTQEMVCFGAVRSSQHMGRPPGKAPPKTTNHNITLRVPKAPTCSLVPQVQTTACELLACGNRNLCLPRKKEAAEKNSGEYLARCKNGHCMHLTIFFEAASGEASNLS